ncbi:MAG TPA: competence protein CoiA family protein [Sporosarcina sp.]|nr:competence protein CoiA family protein [Sporosarcina sp.]
MATILVAKRSNGQLFILHKQWSREQLKQLRKKEQFFCPQCNHVLQLKVGAINIPHFSHQHHKACDQFFSEGETFEHLQGKLDLYHFFQTYPQLNVQIEPYLSELRQRPDLLIYQQDMWKPIEFQVSRIPVEKMQRRTNHYKEHSMDPLWILHTPANLLSLTEGPTMFSINSFTYQFLTNLNNQQYLFTYHPETKTFYYLSNLMHIEKQKYIVNHRKLPLSLQRYPFATPKKLSREEMNQYMMLFNRAREKYIQSAIFYNRQGVNNVFLRSCYELQIVPSLLPSWIGVPITYNDGFIVHPCEWQIAFIYYLHKIDDGKLSSAETIYQQFLYRFYEINEQSLYAVNMYHLFLKRVGYEKIKNTVRLTEQQKLSVILSEYLQK